MDVVGLWRQGVLVDGGCLRGAGYKRGGWIPRMRTMWITGSRTRVLEPGVRTFPSFAHSCTHVSLLCTLLHTRFSWLHRRSPPLHIPCKNVFFPYPIKIMNQPIKFITGIASRIFFRLLRDRLPFSSQDKPLDINKNEWMNEWMNRRVQKSKRAQYYMYIKSHHQCTANKCQTLPHRPYQNSAPLISIWPNQRIKLYTDEEAMAACAEMIKKHIEYEGRRYSRRLRSSW